MTDQVVKMHLFRCDSCGFLVTVNDVEDGFGCRRCGGIRIRIAKTVTEEERAMLDKLYNEGTLKVALSNSPLEKELREGGH